MKLYLVRHAESKRNTGEKSIIDAELTEIGKEQAERLGAYFSKITLQKVYCSPLKRTRATWKGIQRKVHCKNVSYPKEIVEIKMGRFGEHGVDDWSGYFKAATSSGLAYQTYRPEGGESLQDAYERAGKFYQKLLKNHASRDQVLIVGHGFFNLYLILNALGLDLFEGKYFQLNNASVSMLKINAHGKVTHYRINDYQYLISEGIRKTKESL